MASLLCALNRWIICVVYPMVHILNWTARLSYILIERRVQMDKQHKRIRRTQRRPKSGNTHWFTQNDTKKISNWKTPDHDGIHSQQTSTRNEQMPTRSTHTWMDDLRKDHLDPKGPKQSNHPKQLQTHNLPIGDVENINSTTNKERDLLLANKPQIVSWGTERMLQRIQRHSKSTLHRPAHPKQEQDQMEKSSYGLDWLQKGIWYGYARLPQNVQNIKWSHKLYRENYENLESGTDSRRKKLSWSRDPKRYFSRRCTITVTIHNCHDAT